jgi:2-desacetyl-2-hydroxyethyl bacteriochlorophyllide A dehydrogenase
MKAAVLQRPGELTLEERPVPETVDGDLLVKVRAASICGTDLRIHAHGHFKNDGPRVLGHELVGEVVGTGERVTVAPNVGCGHCAMCRDGFNQMCPDYEAFGVTMDGGFQEYMRIPARALGNVFAVPAQVSDADASLVEPLSCCLSGQRKVTVTAEDRVLIIGDGPIGAFHALLARVAGAREVIVSGHNDERLEAIDADVRINSREQDLSAAAQDVDVAIVAVSSAEAQQQAVELLAPHGRLNFFSGLGKARGVEIDSNRVHYKALTLTGTTGSSNGDYTRALELVASGRASLSPLVSGTFALEEIGAALDHARSRAGMKAMVVMET